MLLRNGQLKFHKMDNDDVKSCLALIHDAHAALQKDLVPLWFHMHTHYLKSVKSMDQTTMLQSLTVVFLLASYPGPFEKSEKRAWYPLFAHALN